MRSNYRTPDTGRSRRNCLSLRNMAYLLSGPRLPFMVSPPLRCVTPVRRRTFPNCGVGFSRFSSNFSDFLLCVSRSFCTCDVHDCRRNMEPGKTSRVPVRRLQSPALLPQADRGCLHAWEVPEPKTFGPACSGALFSVCVHQNPSGSSILVRYTFTMDASAFEDRCWS